MKANEILNSFGEDFIVEVRDRTLSDFEMIMSGKMKSEQAQTLHKKIAVLPPESIEILKEVVTNMVDRGLSKTMNYFEESEDFIIGYVNNEGVTDLNELSDGLAGELYSEYGWIQKYSQFAK